VQLGDSQQPHMHRVGQNRIIFTIYDRIYGDFPAKNTPYIYGSGQPYICMLRY
jgi:hypothetical protein